MPFRAPFADGDELAAPCNAACDPWAWVCVVCAGEFCEENLELKLVIHDPRREVFLESGGVVPFRFFSELFRLSSAGRFNGVFWGAVVVAVAVAAGAAAGGGGRGGDAGLLAAGFGSGVCCCSSWRDLADMPPFDRVLGGASLLQPGDEETCWR